MSTGKEKEMQKTLSSEEAFEMIEKKAQKRGMSVCKLAEESGVDKSTVYRMRDGNRTGLMLNTALKLGIAKIVS